MYGFFGIEGFWMTESEFAREREFPDEHLSFMCPKHSAPKSFKKQL